MRRGPQSPSYWVTACTASPHHPSQRVPVWPGRVSGLRPLLHHTGWPQTQPRWGPTVGTIPGSTFVDAPGQAEWEGPRELNE